MRLEDMRYFVEIVNAKSINQASKTLFVAQPALSRTITSMERELGFSLLERSKHGIKTTKAGQEVYNDCVKILQQYAACSRKWKDLSYQTMENFSPVRVVALPMICNVTMNDVFFEIAQQYPKIQLTLFERQLHDVLETTVEEPHSICFSHYNDQTKNDIYHFAREHHMQIIPLFDDEYKFFASSKNPLVGKPLTIDDLKDCTIASYSNRETEENPKFIAAGLTGFTSNFKNAIFLSNRYTIVDLVIANKAINLFADIITLPESYRQNNSIQPLEVTDFHLPMTYFLMMSAEASLEESIVADMLQKHYLALAASTR